ncbi:MAG: prepilin-type N-terminal cleavage/methylation domain-containing protein [Phycisphaerales bacterium]|nr:MAG: prepilin-type N-terminal cleavage/methylation domain-containing protein [Phycisphaerales bacterium]
MITNVSRRFTARHRGYTLAEAMMAVVVLSAAAAGVLLPFSSGAVVQSEGMRRTLAAKLAADLTQQILNTPADQIIGTYDGYSEPQGQVKDAGGTVFTDLNYAKFSRDVGCQYVYVPQESGTTTPQFIRITVRVYYEGREIATVNRLVSQ